MKNRRLTTTGPYAYVKNPLYLGTILISAGFCLLARHYWVLAITAVGFFGYYMPRKKKIEYGRLREIYGEEFDRFQKNVPDLLPQLRPWRSGDPTRFNGRLVFDNSEHGTVMSVMLGFALIYLSVWLRDTGLIPVVWAWMSPR